MLLTPPSQLLLRNSALFEGQSLLLLNHESDSCARELLNLCPRVDALALDFNHFQQLKSQAKAELHCYFGHQLPHTDRFETVVVYYPKAKPLLAYLLELAALHLQPGGQLLVIGENKGGIKSFTKQQSRWFSNAAKLDNARHCLLFAAEAIASPTALDIEAFVSHYSLPTPQGDIQICNMAGVFSEKRLDLGTELLLSHLPKLEGRVLDFGCGAGVIAAALLKVQPELNLDCVDINAMALLSCELTLKANGLSAKVYPSDGLSSTQGEFDAIISNPPFHDGLAATTHIAESFIADSANRLKDRGVWQIVANRHLPYGDTIAAHFGNVNVIAENNKYKLYRNISNKK